LLTIMVMKASFDQKVKQLSDSIRAAIKRWNSTPSSLFSSLLSSALLF
jgi:hypothetical protein